MIIKSRLSGILFIATFKFASVHFEIIMSLLMLTLMSLSQESFFA